MDGGHNEDETDSDGGGIGRGDVDLTGLGLFETNKELAASARITLDEAVKQAVKAVPGKAVEADIGKEDGRTVYKVEIIDTNNKTQKVYVDAVNGQAKIDK